MSAFDVHARGTDPSGRTIYATDYMWDVWERVVADLGFRPVIVQGAFMTRNGGGASASAGYHDQAGCFDLRVWDLPAGAAERVVRTLRRYGCAAWLRDRAHGGMDPHIHFVLGTDKPLTSGAAFQWQAYLNGRDGLASNGPDYHWRPDPLVTRPPEEDDMPNYTDWPKRDREALVDDVVTAIMRYKPQGQKLAVEQLLKQAANAPKVVRSEHAKDRGQ